MALSLGGVKPHVKQAAEYFAQKHGIKNVGGWRAVGSVPNSDHPKGLALDFMTRNKAQGDALAADVIANYKQWNVTYVIWWRRIWSPEKGWRAYTGPVPHTDHVHVSFAATPGSSSGGTAVPVGGNPLVPDSLENLANTVSDFLEKLKDPWIWTALGYFLVGSTLIIVGLIMLSGKSVSGTAKTITKAVR